MHIIKAGDLVFKLKSRDSHILTEPVEGYSIKKVGTHFLTEKALKEFPELRIEGCERCQNL